MKKRKLLLLALILGILLMSHTVLFAQSNPSLFVNGDLKQDVKMIIKNNSTLIPLRFCSEELQGQVNWNPTSQQIIITKGAEVVVFKIGDMTYTHQGIEKKLSVAPELIDGVTYIPFRPIVEALGGVVLYNQVYKFINIYDIKSSAYKVYQGLNTDDITQKRFAMLASPKKTFVEGSYGGSRANSYIFPLATHSNYFFRYYVDEGSLFGLEYFEMQDGIAVEKFSRSQLNSTHINTSHTLLNYLGDGTDIKETGIFPDLDDLVFVSFYNRNFEVSSQKDILDYYAPGNTTSIIKKDGKSSLDISIDSELKFSPYDALTYFTIFDESLFN